MIDILKFVYEHYEYYFVLITCMLASLIAFIIFKKKVVTVYEKCFCYSLSIISNFVISIIFIHKFWVYRENMRIDILAFIIENILSFFIALVLSVLIIHMKYFYSCFTKKYNVSKWINDNKWGLGICSFLSITMILELPAEINGWGAVWYATDYSMGIGARFFIGTLLSLLNVGYIETSNAYLFCVVSVVLVIILFSIVLNELIKKTEEKYRNVILFVLGIFIASPGSIAGIWQPGAFGRLETYGLMISLFAIIIFEKHKNIYLKYIFVTVLSCVSMAIYQGDIFLYYPIILMLFVYDSICSGEHLKTKRILGFVNVFFTGMTFIYFQFFSYTNFNSSSEMANVISLKTDLPISQMTLEFGCFQSVIVAFQSINRHFLLGSEFPREKTFFTLCLMMPVVVLVLAIYLKCDEYRKERNIGILKVPYMYYIILPVAVLPQYLLNVDWGRWMRATVIVFFAGILYLTYKRDEGILRAMEKLNKFISEHKFLCLLCIIFMASLDKFTERPFIDEVDTITGYFLPY